jgi:hypothetical protein
MALNGEQLGRLHNALLDAFRSPGDLEQLIAFGLDTSLAEVAANDVPLSKMVFDVLNWAEAHGRTKELVRQARVRNMGNEELAQTAEALFPGLGGDLASTPPAEVEEARSRYLAYLKSECG